MNKSCRMSIAACALAACVAVSASAAEVTSVASGDWHAGATWSSGAAPAAADTVVIADGHTVTMAEAFTAYTVSNLAVIGTLTHTANSTTALGERYKVSLTVLNDLDISGAISVNGRGYAANNGPGTRTVDTDSSAHGGVGGDYGSGPTSTT